MRTLPLFCLLLMTSSGCVAYDAACPADETSVVGYTDSLLDLRREYVRTREAAVGNLITDAFYDHLRGERVDIAVVNAGAIRDRTDCRATEFIDRGPVTLGDLADTMPFDNSVALVEVTEKQLWDALEHSVARLGDPGEAGFAGQFLQVSHLRVTVDCSFPAADGQQGRRVREVVVIDSSGNDEVLDFDVRSETRVFRVGVNTFLAEGNDGYDMFRGQKPIADERPDFVVVANYIANQPNQTISPAVEARLDFDPNCYPRAP